MESLSAPLNHNLHSRGRLRRACAIIIVLLALNTSATFCLQVQVAETKRTSPVSSSTGALGKFRGSKQAPYLVSASSNNKKCSPLFQSTECDNAEAYPSRRLLDTASENLANLQRVMVNTGRALPAVLSTSTEKALYTLKKSWWCLPMVLALVPPYFALMYKTHPSMPAFWPLVKLDHLFHSPYAAVMLGVFLLSNIAYFVSGAYLFLRYHLSVPSEASEIVMRDPLLGGSVLAAGTISTVFHSVQALGPQSLAECLCFIDHGVAISSVFYFWRKCGKPSRNTLVLSVFALATLTITEGYAWLHSAWHILSASAAVAWAQDGLERAQQED